MHRVLVHSILDAHTVRDSVYSLPLRVDTIRLHFVHDIPTHNTPYRQANSAIGSGAATIGSGAAVDAPVAAVGLACMEVRNQRMAPSHFSTVHFRLPPGD